MRISDWSSDVCSSDLYMEAVTMPLEWADFPEQARDLFQAFRSQAGEELVLQDNVFVEQVLPGLILRPLSEAEMAAYREPFLAAGKARRPTLSWPRQIPSSEERRGGKECVSKCK